MNPNDKTPASNEAKLFIQPLSTPIGDMLMGAVTNGLCLLQFTDKNGVDKELERMARDLNASIQEGANGHIEQCQQQMAEYFEGQRQTFTIPLVLSGTDFQQQVWQALAPIPFGQTQSYQAQATAINKPTAVRAVAAANGANHLSIILPCHRVIGKNGALTGYASGVDKKQWLLQHEQRVLSQSSQ